MRIKEICKHENTTKRGNQYVSGIKCLDCKEWIEKTNNKGEEEEEEECKHENTAKRGNQHVSGIKCLDCKEWIEKTETETCKHKNAEQIDNKDTKCKDCGTTHVPQWKPTTATSRKDRPGYVYVMQGSDKERIKIGRSTNVEDRLKKAKTFDPDMMILSTFYSEDHVRAENAVHKVLSEYRIIKYGPGNEWFKVDRFIANKAISDVVKEISPLPIE